VRYTAVPALKLAAGAVPPWRRHLPAALALAALAALVLALAKPQKTVAVPVERASIMLVTDHSRSMSATDVEPDRLSAAQRAARTFLNTLPDQVRVGAVAFSDTPDAVQAPSSDHDDARRIVDGQVADGATATGAALEVAIDALKNDKQNGKRPPSAIVLLSDGAATGTIDPVSAAQAARKLRIPIYTVALGTAQGTITVPRPGGAGGTETRSVPPDPQSLAEVAKASGGKTYAAADASKLSDVYKSLGSLLGTKNEKRQVTAGFAGGALVLLLLGAAMSLRWFGRLI
jgi:Ca-activated chloride channel homolog